ncbi:hypothetical protein DXD60_07690 [Bifidobacterium adolescentis]|jgi:hypothetical protein|uniref:hypothetical protein n=1 Tax=Bifidobacterium adolescentis TaxID=1680 RepID=UPI000E40B328|nr:hypothetical protein [Bifidobacterium adolescentis]RGJ41709.1 hypothetical protein DXD60_07690 [Bifidobacterium adolescentis]RGV16383.1 hypothetical protein DWW22_03370 [Bifidobacterium adolescentis]DAI98972.1 MAG TPA: Protein of unknown function (DUF2570) [Caudoviricetes sp.]
MNSSPWDWTLSATLTVIGLAITLAIAVAGWIITARKDSKSAKAAREKYESDARRADELNATLKSQLEASRESAAALRAQVEQLKEANRIAISSNPPDKAPWGDSVWTGSGELFSIHHEGLRKVIVLEVRSADPRMSGLLHFDHATPFSCEPGDSIEYLAIGTQLGRPDVEIRWRWADDDTERTTRRPSIKPRS